MWTDPIYEQLPNEHPVWTKEVDLFGASLTLLHSCLTPFSVQNFSATDQSCCPLFY